MSRWALLVLGLALAGGAGVTLLSSSPPARTGDVAAGPPEFGLPEGEELHPEIDAASRRALAEVLRDTEGPE